MVKLNKIYTRTGDDGTTGLVDGTRRAKHDARMEAIGEVDEANSRDRAGGAALAMARPRRRCTASRTTCSISAPISPRPGERFRAVGNGPADRPGAGRVARSTRSTRLNEQLDPADQLHPARRQRGGGAGSCRARRGAPGRAGDDRAGARRAGQSRRAGLCQPAVGLPVRARPRGQRDGRGRRDCGFPAQTASQLQRDRRR